MFITFESLYLHFSLNSRHIVMSYIYCEMHSKLSKTRRSPLVSVGKIISSQFPASWSTIICVYVTRKFDYSDYTQIRETFEAISVIYFRFRYISYHVFSTNYFLSVFSSCWGTLWNYDIQSDFTSVLNNQKILVWFLFYGPSTHFRSFSGAVS